MMMMSAGSYLKIYKLDETNFTNFFFLLFFSLCSLIYNNNNYYLWKVFISITEVEQLN